MIYVLLVLDQKWSMRARLKKLNWIAVRVFQLDLFAAGTSFHFVEEMQPSFFERRNTSRKVGDLKDYAVPSAWLLLATARHWSRP
jgi:hypothetical protein